jgi:serine/threonine protein kinase
MSLEETGIRYYMKQICAGVQYMHDMRVIHNDIHAGNILLKYKADGTKTCMLCDFGLSKILRTDAVIDNETFSMEIMRLCLLMASMFTPRVKPSKEANEVTDGVITRNPRFGRVFTTVREMMAMPWFSMTAVAPIPKSPTPLLGIDAVKSMKFAPSRNPAGVTEDEEVEPKPRAGPSGSDDQMQTVEIDEPSRARRASLRDQVRTRIRSVGLAISQPFRRLSRQSGSSRRRRNQDE